MIKIIKSYIAHKYELDGEDWDDVCIAQVIWNPYEGAEKYVVVVKKGECLTSDLTAIVLHHSDEWFTANTHAKQSYYARITNGYKDIHNDNYKGPLSLERSAWLQTWVYDTSFLKQGDMQETKDVEHSREVRLKCVDNTGMSDVLSKDTVYDAEMHCDPEMVWVLNETGEKQEYLYERFIEVQ